MVAVPNFLVVLVVAVGKEKGFAAAESLAESDVVVHTADVVAEAANGLLQVVLAVDQVVACVVAVLVVVFVDVLVVVLVGVFVVAGCTCRDTTVGFVAVSVVVAA